MESLLIMCCFLLSLICLFLILNHLKNYLDKINSDELNDLSEEKQLNEIILDPEEIKKLHEKIIKESNVIYPTESHNKFAFKIFKHFSGKNKGFFYLYLIYY
jgi:serine/threonine-protein kinase RIO1